MCNMVKQYMHICFHSIQKLYIYICVYNIYIYIYVYNETRRLVSLTRKKPNDSILILLLETHTLQTKRILPDIYRL